MGIAKASAMLMLSILCSTAIETAKEKEGQKDE